MFFLFTFVLKQRRKKFAVFKNLNFFTKLKTFKTHCFLFLSFINLPCGHVISHKKFGPDRLSRFDVYWIQTNKQTPIQTDSQVKFIYRFKISLAVDFFFNCFMGIKLYKSIFTFIINLFKLSAMYYFHCQK